MAAPTGPVPPAAGPPEPRTAEARLGELARRLEGRGLAPGAAARFLGKCAARLFAEDLGLAPGAPLLHLLARWGARPAVLRARLDALPAPGVFGAFGAEPAPELDAAEVGLLRRLAEHDWAAVEPALLGTLFERSLDRRGRARSGAHYTARADVLAVLGPVLVEPLQREWGRVRRELAGGPGDAGGALERFLGRLASVRVLDPACGTGNFLYVALQLLFDLEREVLAFAAVRGLDLRAGPRVGPGQLRGIEVDPRAAEITRLVIRIGHRQGRGGDPGALPAKPRPGPRAAIERRDAVLDRTAAGAPVPAAWPAADFVVGNPPFAGRKKKRRLLGELFGPGYFDDLAAAYRGSVPPGADLCCHWFELARREVERDPAVRVGLVATQGIRGGSSRRVLDRIRETGELFFAVADREWTVDDTLVHVSLIGFDGGLERRRRLDGRAVARIHADLTSGEDATRARRLEENRGLAFQGVIPVGPFELGPGAAAAMLRDRRHPDGRSNAEVVRPWARGGEVLNGRAPAYVVDFGAMDEVEAAGFEAPMRHVRESVLPLRRRGGNPEAARTYWRHWRPRPALRRAIRARCNGRYLITARHSKHRIFLFVAGEVLPSDATVAIARGDDYAFGVLQSAVHVLWSRRRGTQVREAETGMRYSHTFTFETFPFPWPPGREPAGDPHLRRLEEAAGELHGRRERWLEPPQILAELRARAGAELAGADVPEEAREALHALHVRAAAAADPRLAGRTFTALYNADPPWLRRAHERLDRAVLAAYAASDPSGGWSEDWAAVWAEGDASRRRAVERRVIAGCLRLNRERTGTEPGSSPNVGE